jgi:hypothetical protein
MVDTLVQIPSVAVTVNGYTPAVVGVVAIVVPATLAERPEPA